MINLTKVYPSKVEGKCRNQKVREESKKDRLDYGFVLFCMSTLQKKSSMAYHPNKTSKSTEGKRAINITSAL